jgi:hypothetical protein
MSTRAKQVYVFRAKLRGWRGVRRTIAIPCDHTLGDLHRALQAAFGWADDHAYAFWLGGKFRAKDETAYVHPRALAAVAAERKALRECRRRKSAERRLERLKLVTGQRVAYLFDSGDSWRVRLTLREITAGDGGHYPRVLEAVGDAPPQYSSVDEERLAA